MGGSKTFINIAVSPVIGEVGETDKLNRLNKDQFAYATTFIGQNMKSVLKARETTIVKMKSAFNANLMRALGYESSSTTQYRTLNTSMVLDYLQLNNSPLITSVDNVSSGSLNMTDLTIKYMQDNYDGFTYSYRRFLYTDDMFYQFLSATVNGLDLISVSSYKLLLFDDAKSYINGMITTLVDYVNGELGIVPETFNTTDSFEITTSTQEIDTGVIIIDATESIVDGVVGIRVNINYYVLVTTDIPVLDAEGNHAFVLVPLLDAGGNIIYEDGDPILDSEGNPTGEYEQVVVMTEQYLYEEVVEPRNANVHVPLDILQFDIPNPQGTHVQTVLDTYSDTTINITNPIYTYRIMDEDGYFQTIYSLNPPDNMISNSNTSMTVLDSFFTTLLTVSLSVDVTPVSSFRFNVNTTLADSFITQNFVDSPVPDSILHLVDMIVARETQRILNEIDEYSLLNVSFIKGAYTINEDQYLFYFPESEAVLYNMFTITEVDMYPIIPIMKDKEIINTTKQKIALSSFGFTGSDFEDSLRSEDSLYHANIGFVVNVNDTHPGVIKCMYNMFRDLVKGDDPEKGPATLHNINVEFDNNTMSFTAAVTVNKVIGVIGDVGDYTHEFQPYEAVDQAAIDSMDGVPINTPMINEIRRIYRKQEDPEYYMEVVVDKVTARYRMSGYDETYNSNDPECRVPIVFSSLRTVPFDEMLYVLSQGLSLIAYSKKTVKLKWYQTGLFMILLVVVIIVVTYFCAPCGNAIGGAVTSMAGNYAALAWAITGSVVVTTAVYTTMVYIVAAALVVQLSSMVLGIDMGILGDAAGAVTLVGGIAGTGYGITNIIEQGIRTSMDLMPIATTLTSTASAINNAMLAKDAKTLAASMIASNRELEKAQEQLEEVLDELGIGLLMAPSLGGYDYDYMYNAQYNYDSLYNFDSRFAV